MTPNSKKKPVSSKNRSENTSAAQVDMILAPYIRKAASLLKVDMPKFVIVDILYESSINGEKMFCLQQISNEMSIPSDAYFLGGRFMDQQDTVYISRKCPYYDNTAQKTIFDDLTIPEILYISLHELRHKWQFEYQRKKINNSPLLTNGEDPADIDADGFAMAFLISDCTPYSSFDLPSIMLNIAYNNELDHGARIQRARELIREYDFHRKRSIC